MEYRGYRIVVHKTANDMFEAIITRLDGRNIRVPINNTTPVSITTNARPSREVAIQEAQRMIDGGGMN